MRPLLALVWVNFSATSYETLWHTDLAVRLGHMGVTLDLRELGQQRPDDVFFFIFGLEARREFDMGELRERGGWRCRWWPGSAAWSCRC